MLSLFQKSRVIGLGNLHDLADRVIDMNSPAAVRQLIRDLDSAAEKVNESLAQNSAERSGLARDLTALHTQEAQLNLDSEALVTAGKDESAKQVLLRLQTVESQIQAKEAQQATATTTRSNLQNALSAISSKSQVMQLRLSELESMTTTAAGLEAGARAMQTAQQATDSIDGAGLDDMASRAQHRLDVAQAHFDQANQADTVSDDMANVEVNARLAALKAKLGQQVPA